MAPLEAHLDLAHLDLRGCGRSEGPGAFSGFDWRTWAADVEALRRHLGVERWLAIGHSFGAALAVQYVLEQPGRVSGVVLWAPCLAPAAPGERHATAGPRSRDRLHQRPRAHPAGRGARAAEPPRLTPAEAALAAALRTHLKSLLGKTRTGRQAELLTVLERSLQAAPRDEQD